MPYLIRFVLFCMVISFIPGCYHKIDQSVAASERPRVAVPERPGVAVPGPLRYIEYPDTPRLNVDLQLGGPALGFSMNYERRFVREKDEFAIRAGLGISGGNPGTHSRSLLMLPLQAVYRAGNHRNHFEFGGGIIFLHSGTFPPNQHYHIASFSGIDIPGDHRDITMITASLGYRIPIFLPNNDNNESHLSRTNNYISFGLSSIYAFRQTGFSFYFSYGFTF